jgi:hypothetical protein
MKALTSSGFGISAVEFENNVWIKMFFPLYMSPRFSCKCSSLTSKYLFRFYILSLEITFRVMKLSSQMGGYKNFQAIRFLLISTAMSVMIL